MKNTPQIRFLPTKVNFVQAGEGVPVIMAHGLAASLHDWDELLPELAQNGYAGYALDLLGHGDSASSGDAGATSDPEDWRSDLVQV